MENCYVQIFAREIYNVADDCFWWRNGGAVVSLVLDYLVGLVCVAGCWLGLYFLSELGDIFWQELARRRSCWRTRKTLPIFSDFSKNLAWSLHRQTGWPGYGGQQFLEMSGITTEQGLLYYWYSSLTKTNHFKLRDGVFDYKRKHLSLYTCIKNKQPHNYILIHHITPTPLHPTLPSHCMPGT